MIEYLGQVPQKLITLDPKCENIVVLGAPFCGKTSAIMQYLQVEYSADYCPTQILRFSFDVKTPQEKLKTRQIEITDTSGDLESKETKAFFSAPQPLISCFILCFSIIDRESFQYLNKTLIPMLKKQYHSVPFIIVGLKEDLRENQHTLRELRKKGTSPIAFETAKRSAFDSGAAQYLECSARTGRGLKSVFDLAITTSIVHVPSKKGRFFGKKGKSSKKAFTALQALVITDPLFPHATGLKTKKPGDPDRFAKVTKVHVSDIDIIRPFVQEQEPEQSDAKTPSQNPPASLPTTTPASVEMSFEEAPPPIFSAVSGSESYMGVDKTYSQNYADQHGNVIESFQPPPSTVSAIPSLGYVDDIDPPPPSKSPTKTKVRRSKPSTKPKNKSKSTMVSDDLPPPPPSYWKADQDPDADLLPDYTAVSERDNVLSDLQNKSHTGLNHVKKPARRTPRKPASPSGSLSSNIERYNQRERQKSRQKITDRIDDPRARIFWSDITFNMESNSSIPNRVFCESFVKQFVDSEDIPDIKLFSDVLIKSFDINSDGNISIEEFNEILRSSPLRFPKCVFEITKGLMEQFAKCSQCSRLPPSESMYCPWCPPHTPILNVKQCSCGTVFEYHLTDWISCPKCGDSLESASLPLELH